MENGTRLMIFAPVVRDEPAHHGQLLKRLRREGFARVRINHDQICELEDSARLGQHSIRSIEVVVDRLIVRPTFRNRLADSLELAIALTGGDALVEAVDGPQMSFSENAVCPTCGISQPELTPASFSFNSPHGACRSCDGLGLREAFDPELLVPNPNLSLREGAVKPWAHRHSVHFLEFLEALTAHYHTDVFRPYQDLPPHFRTVLMYGSGKEAISFFFHENERRQTHARPFEGLIPVLQRRWEEARDARTRDELRPYLRSQPCAACDGTRLNSAARHVRVGNLTLPAFSAFSAADALDHARALDLKGHQREIAAKILSEVISRLAYLVDVG
ncbi:MAG: excinuclease ABC subunit UvrA, partial [Desulfosarcina sp.]|nr:excinuclease ABC subunit UvrA [Desulfobacterales bacterium]